MKNCILKITYMLLMIGGVAAQANEQVKHIPGVFIGVTHIDNEAEFTFGVEYEYKLDKQWGLGLIYERTNNAHHGDGVSVSLASAYFHPNKSIRLGVGIGEERVGGSHSHSDTLYRLSAAYDFHIGEFGIAPAIAVDFVNDQEALVIGFAVTRPF